jgi:hypothetical protein
MKSVKIIGLVIALAAFISAPASAAELGGECSVQQFSGDYTPTQALSALNGELGAGGNLNTASDADVMAAFGKAIGANKSITVALASVIAAGRPDLVDQLNGQISALCPTAAATLMQAIEEAANNPTPDQLAAIANDSGAAPAAGGAGGDGSP